MSDASRSARLATAEPSYLRWILIAIAVLFLSLFLILPLAVVLVEALRVGLRAYMAAILESDALAALRLTLLVAAIVVPLNLLFGLAAAWAITKFDFSGKNFLITLIDLPLSISPVVAGLLFILLFGSEAWLGALFKAQGISILFALPSMVLVTLFITFPFVARELIPLMQQQGRSDEEAALTLGASPLKMFWTVTLPNIKWALLYGLLLCNARAMGEFGAVFVVSGRIAGETNTLPLQIEYLYQGHDMVGAFALASLLTWLAFMTIIAKTILEWRHGEALAPTHRLGGA